ncbi:SMP-30/gluconolactonase/LRE family protein [Bosea sp. AS-1]|uniref:SMP-30/gluconolactonase/LRE family protein n=1 Tax=Bosea sp. AS-1 TaxID=2015316 RepID=UPI000B78FACF|nr:SMP-30/gluconolactonase/LRE family protein [Bosea sp. AS-1]
MKTEIETVLPGPFALGEGPCWHGGEGALYFVDALAPAIHRWSPAGGLDTWPMPEIVGSFAIRRGGGLIASLQTGFATVDLTNGGVQSLVDPEPEKPANVLNDGKCDRKGRFWCGSRDGALKDPSGALYRLDPDFSVQRMDQGFIVSNGIAFSPDDRTMYFADSRAETVFAYDFDIDTGTISNRRVFFSTRDIEGRCDGATVDAEGFYWCALVHGGKIARVDPKGRFDRLIDMPVKHPTMCTFGGDGLDVLYVTSAASMLSEAERANNPQAGNLFAIHGLGVKGLPEPLFAG